MLNKIPLTEGGKGILLSIYSSGLSSHRQLHWRNIMKNSKSRLCKFMWYVLIVKTLKKKTYLKVDFKPSVGLQNTALQNTLLISLYNTNETVCIKVWAPWTAEPSLPIPSLNPHTKTSPCLPRLSVCLSVPCRKTLPKEPWTVCMYVWFERPYVTHKRISVFFYILVSNTIREEAWRMYYIWNWFSSATILINVFFSEAMESNGNFNVRS